MPIITETDSEGAFDWSTRTTEDSFTAGILTRLVTTTFDDGHVEQSLHDDGDGLGWQRIDITYADGVVTGFGITYDPEVAAGYIASTGAVANWQYSIQHNATDAEDWMFRVTRMGSPTNGETVTYYDTGNQLHERFANGVIWMTMEYDYGQQEDWTRIVTGFDSTTGVITSRSTTFDNGLGLIETFTDGVVSSSITQDHYNVEDYWSVRTFHEAGGTVYALETQWDDGSVTYEDLREFRVQTDDSNSANWESISTLYNMDGSRNSQVVVYDSGRVLEQEFVDDQVTRSLRTEANGDTFLAIYEDGRAVSTLNEDVSGTNSWETISMAYDAEGRAAHQRIVLDDGREMDSWYTDGVMSFKVQDDLEDAFEWQTLTWSYENGQMTQQDVLYDNGDVLLRVYENGQRKAHLVIDGDDSHDWAVQVVEYGVGVSTYASIDDVPEAYADVLAPYQEDVFLV